MKQLVLVIEEVKHISVCKENTYDRLTLPGRGCAVITSYQMRDAG